MSLFRLDASIREHGSASRSLADIVEQSWRTAATSPQPGDADVTRRDIGLHPLPADAWRHAATGSTLPEEQRSPIQRGAAALAAGLVDELVEADDLLFAVPLYNYGVAQQFKAYVDLVLTDPRMAPGPPSAIAGKPAVLVTVQGGNYDPGTPKEGWDHSTPWLRRILADVWGTDLTVVQRSFTFVGVVPALDQFADLAAGLRATAEAEAAVAGRALAAARVAS